MTRVAQIAQQTLTLKNVLSAQQRLQDAQIKIATGRKSQTYAGIAGDASRLVSLESLQTRVDRILQNNGIVENRLERMDQAVSTIFDSASELRTLIIQALNAPSSGAVPVGTVAQYLLDVVAGQLNTKENGRFLFSGIRTGTPAVQVPVPDPATFGVADAGYYQGDSVELTARIDESITITYGMTADRVAFQQTIAALKAAIQADSTGDTSLLSTALDLANSAIQTLAGYRTEIGADLDAIAAANQRNNDFLVFVEGAISDIENVDIPATVAQLATEQTILQASYFTLAQMGRLSLVDFLR